MLLWACLLRLSPQRPRADVVHQHANYLLNELKRSQEAEQLPVQSVDDGLFALAAFIDEVAMSLPDLRMTWQQAPLQAQRHNSNNAGVEVFQRLQRVRTGPRSVLGTYAAVLGAGFMGCYGLPGADQYAVVQLRRELGLQLGVDPDRDWTGGAIRKVRKDEIENLDFWKTPWYRSVWVGRAIAAVLAISGCIAVAIILAGRLR
ncbi:MAG: DotU family type IV/VI secretion system protein [Myxococcales bacterium]|nr:DotU family type IV/VI secretion system protein [Myxococcales bacterium]